MNKSEATNDDQNKWFNDFEYDEASNVWLLRKRRVFIILKFQKSHQFPTVYRHPNRELAYIIRGEVQESKTT